MAEDSPFQGALPERFPRSPEPRQMCLLSRPAPGHYAMVRNSRGNNCSTHAPKRKGGDPEPAFRLIRLFPLES
jgi:hypothetical protein